MMLQQPSALLISILGLAAGCDTLVLHPMAADARPGDGMTRRPQDADTMGPGAFSLQIVDPPTGRRIIQPGQTIALQLRLQGCQQATAINAWIGAAQLESSGETQVDESGRALLQVDTASILRSGAWDVDDKGQAVEVNLRASANCAGQKQPAFSSGVQLAISPAVIVQRSALQPPFSLHATGELFRVIVAAKSGLLHFRYWLPLRGLDVPQLQDSAEQLLQQQGDARLWLDDEGAWLWKSCVFCAADRAQNIYQGTLYGLRLPLDLRGQRRSLLCTPFDVARRPGHDELLIANRSCSRPADRLQVLDLRFEELESVRADIELVTPLRRQQGRLVALGVGGSDDEGPARLLVADTNAISTRELGFRLPRTHIVATADEEGRAAWVAPPSTTMQLMALETDTVPRSTELAELNSPLPLRMVSGEVALADDADRLRLVDFATGAVKWERRLGATVAGIAPIGDGEVVVLSTDGGVFVLDGSGNRRAHQDMSALGEAKSDLLVTDDGLVHFALLGPFNSWLVTYQIPLPLDASQPIQ